MIQQKYQTIHCVNIPVSACNVLYRKIYLKTKWNIRENNHLLQPEYVQNTRDFFRDPIKLQIMQTVLCFKWVERVEYPLVMQVNLRDWHCKKKLPTFTVHEIQSNIDNTGL